MALMRSVRRQQVRAFSFVAPLTRRYFESDVISKEAMPLKEEAVAHICKQLVEAAQYLQSVGMTQSQLTQLHHFSSKGRVVRFNETINYFRTNRELGANNTNYAARLIYVANEYRHGGQRINSLIQQALGKWPL